MWAGGDFRLDGVLGGSYRTRGRGCVQRQFLTADLATNWIKAPIQARRRSGTRQVLQEVEVRALLMLSHWDTQRTLASTTDALNMPARFIGDTWMRGV